MGRKRHTPNTRAWKQYISDACPVLSRTHILPSACYAGYSWPGKHKFLHCLSYRDCFFIAFRGKNEGKLLPKICVLFCVCIISCRGLEAKKTRPFYINMSTVSSDVSKQGRHGHLLSVHLWVYGNPPMPHDMNDAWCVMRYAWKVDHTIGESFLLFLNSSVGSFTFPSISLIAEGKRRPTV